MAITCLHNQLHPKKNDNIDAIMSRLDVNNFDENLVLMDRQKLPRGSRKSADIAVNKTKKYSA